MSFFLRPNYTSDVTAFVAKLKADNPQLEAQQRAGRALLWDKTTDRQTQAGFDAARVPQTAYVYQTKA